MSLGGISDYLRANNISIPENSGTYLPYANQGPYEDIMAQMRASGGRGVSGGATGGGGTTGGTGTGGAMGGYDPNLYKRVAAASQAAGSGVIPEFSSIGPGTTGQRLYDVNDPTAWGNLSDAQQANYYANNPGMGSVLSKAVNLISGTTLGAMHKKLMPDLYENTLLKMSGINPTATSEINTGNTAQDPMQRQELARQLGLLQTPESDGGFTPVATTSPVTYAPIMTADLSSDYSNEGRNYVAPAPVAVTSPFTGGSEFSSVGGGGGGYGGSYGGDNSGDNRGWGSRDAGGDSGGGYAKGGSVSMSRLQGPNPMGPDDGYATLKSGEFVINDKAVKKYGIELMNAINSGKISKGKLRGLLEM